MRFAHDGISLWYGTSDAPAPSEPVQPGNEIPVTVGVQPIDASNQVEVRYRINQAPMQAVVAKWLRTDPSRKAQYFRARLPAFRAGDMVDYTAICRCAGRQVPVPEEAGQFMSSFHVAGPKATPTAVIAPPSQPRLAFGHAPLRPDDGDIEPRPKPRPGSDDIPPGPPPPVPPSFPDIALEGLVCLTPPQRALLCNAIQNGLTQAEAQLRTIGVTLFPSPMCYSNCFDIERGGAWGGAIPGVAWEPSVSGAFPPQQSDRDRRLQSFQNFLEGIATGFNSAAIIITQNLLDKLAWVIDRLLTPLFQSKGIVLQQTRISLEGRNRVRTTWIGKISGDVLPFPLNLWPPSWTVTLIETLSIEDVAMDCVPKKFVVNSEVSTNVDVDLLERIFLDLGFLSFFGLFPGILVPPGIFEGILAYYSSKGDSLAKALLTGQRSFGPAATLLPALPNVILIPGTCQKTVLDYTSIDIYPALPVGIRIGFNICPPVNRQMAVEIRGDGVITVPVDPLDPPAVSAAGVYSIVTQDLRPPLQIVWSATSGSTIQNPNGASTQITFDIAGTSPSQTVRKLVRVSVTDADNCSAQSQLLISIKVITLTEPPPKPHPRVNGV